MGIFKNTFKYGDSWAWLVTTYCQVTWNQIHLLHLSSNLTWDIFKIIFSEFEIKSNSKRHTIWLTVTDSSHKVSTIKSIYINMKIYLLKDLSKNLIKYTNFLLARVKCECYSLGQMSPSNALQLNKLRRNRTVTSTRSLAKTGKNNMENSGWWNIEGAF